MGVLLLPVSAVVAGMISFSSPCCLPLIPGYLSYVSALPVSELGRREARAVTLRAALLFVGGFTAVFTALGVSFAFVGSALLRDVPNIIRVAGAVIIAMGLAMIGVLRIPLLYREGRFDLGRMPSGPRTAFFNGHGVCLRLDPASFRARVAILLHSLAALTLPSSDGRPSLLSPSSHSVCERSTSRPAVT